MSKYNKELLQENIDLVTKDLMKEAFFLALRDGVTSVAPLGFSGDTIILYGDEYTPERGHRESSVSFRMYCDDVEILITDIKGNFLFYGRLRKELGVEVVIDHYWMIFQLTKPYIHIELERLSKSFKINPAVTYTEGFKMLGVAIPEKFKIKRNFFQKAIDYLKNLIKFKSL